MKFRKLITATADLTRAVALAITVAIGCVSAATVVTPLALAEGRSAEVAAVPAGTATTTCPLSTLCLDSSWGG